MKNSDFAVIFDMDGVIFDSERAYIDVFAENVRKDGLPFIEEPCIESIGVTIDITRGIFHRYYGSDFDFEYYYHKGREVLMDRGVDLKPCVFELFDYLRSKEVPVALASSTHRPIVTRMLSDAGLIDYFDVLVCGDSVAHSKPHPEIFLKAAEELGTAPQNCYVIEDSFNGIRAAHAAHTHPIMVPDIVQPDEEIRSLAQAVLPSLCKVKEYLIQRRR